LIAKRLMGFQPLQTIIINYYICDTLPSSPLLCLYTPLLLLLLLLLPFTYSQKGHMELANLEPSMRDLQHQLRMARKQFAKQSCIAEAKRMQLDLWLSSSLGVSGREGKK